MKPEQGEPEESLDLSAEEDALLSQIEKPEDKQEALQELAWVGNLEDKRLVAIVVDRINHGDEGWSEGNQSLPPDELRRRIRLDGIRRVINKSEQNPPKAENPGQGQEALSN